MKPSQFCWCFFALHIIFFNNNGESAKIYNKLCKNKLSSGHQVTRKAREERNYHNGWHMCKKSAQKGHYLKHPKHFPKKFFCPKKFSIACFKKWGEKSSRKGVKKSAKKSAQKSLVPFKSTQNSAQKSSFLPKKVSI